LDGWAAVTDFLGRDPAYLYVTMALFGLQEVTTRGPAVRREEHAKNRHVTVEKARQS